MTILVADEDPILSEITQEKYASAFKIFAKRIQREDESLMCSIHNFFAGPESQNHNCLACNFEEVTDQILKFLFVCQNNSAYFSTQQSFSIYAQLLNLVWERISDVFEILSVPEGYRVRHFGVLIRARRWANFFKHPKVFAWMVHHPEYTFEGSSHSTTFLNDSDYLKIDDEFVKEFYASEKPKGLTKKFVGHENKVVVILPDIETLTIDLCASLEKFVEIVTENPVYREILDEKSTFVDYFSQDEDL